MTDKTLIISAGLGVIAAISVIIAILTRRFTRSDAMGIAAGSLVIPFVFLLGLIYSIMTMAVDDPAPGNLLFGGFTAIAGSTPFTFLVSWMIVKLLSRRFPLKAVDPPSR